MASLSLEIVTGEEIVYEDDDVSRVIAPGAEGVLGILPSHAPLVTLLKEGALRVGQNGSEELLAVHGGFLEVLNDKVVVLADSAEPAADIDIERAEAARDRAEEALRHAEDDEDIVVNEAALRRATVRLHLGQVRRTQG